MTDGKIKPRLLIVEDDKENQKFLNIFLRKTYELDFCDSGVTFYEKLGSKDYDLILMDVTIIGEKDGFQLVTELRNSPQYRDMPVVGLSAHAYQNDIEKGYRAGFDIFITKPVKGALLLESLSGALAKKSGVK